MQTLTRNPLADPGILGVNLVPASLLCWAPRCLAFPAQEQLLMAFAVLWLRR